MLTRIANRISVLLENYGIIETSNIEVYAYGLELFFMKTGLYLIVLCLSLITHSLIISLFFVIAYIALRQYTGGFHCSTALRCILVSLLMFNIMVVIYKINLHFIFDILFLMSVCGLIVIIVHSPIESPNKPLTLMEARRYRRISIVLSISLFLVSAVCWAFHIVEVYYPISYALLADSILLLLEEGKNEKKDP